MLELNQTQLNEDIAIIQLFHGRLGDELAKSLAYHTGNFWHIEHLDQKNWLVGKYIDILYAYRIYNDATINALYNILTQDDIQSIIDYCYRLLEPYNIEPYQTHP
jgi:hypothetical protein